MSCHFLMGRPIPSNENRIYFEGKDKTLEETANLFEENVNLFEATGNIAFPFEGIGSSFEEPFERNDNNPFEGTVNLFEAIGNASRQRRLSPRGNISALFCVLRSPRY